MNCPRCGKPCERWPYQCDMASGEIIGVNERTYPCADKHDRNDPAGVTVRVVLVEGDIGDYAAYVGVGPAEWVARHGDKISFEKPASTSPACTGSGIVGSA